MFHWINEYFETVANLVKVSNDGSTITGLTGAHSWANASHGAMRIKATDTGIYKWKLTKHGGSVVIGISDKRILNVAFVFIKSANYYINQMRMLCIGMKKILYSNSKVMCLDTLLSNRMQITQSLL